MTRPRFDEWSGTCRALRWRFAWWPTWTDDRGWVTWRTYQIAVIERQGARFVFRLAGYLNQWTRSWSTPTVCRGDGLIALPFLAEPPAHKRILTRCSRVARRWLMHPRASYEAATQPERTHWLRNTTYRQISPSKVE